MSQGIPQSVRHFQNKNALVINRFGCVIKAINVAKPHLDEALLVYRAKKFCTTTNGLDFASTASAIVHVFLFVVGTITRIMIVQGFDAQFVGRQ